MSKLRFLKNPLTQHAVIAKTAVRFANKAVEYARATGVGDFKLALKNRHRAAKAVAVIAERTTSVPPIQRVVNARAKGITFRRIGGRIVPIRPKARGK